MKNYDVFAQHYELSTDSPTGIITKRSGKPAGYKNLSCQGYYYWVICTRYKNRYYKWTIPRVLFELHTGTALSNRVTIGFIDGNDDNLSINNLCIRPRKQK